MPCLNLSQLFFKQLRHLNCRGFYMLKIWNGFRLNNYITEFIAGTINLNLLDFQLFAL
jgi:hypothetical protein